MYTFLDLKDMNLIALGTAVQLFRLKVVPTLTYGIELIWEYLSYCIRINHSQSVSRPWINDDFLWY